MTTVKKAASINEGFAIADEVMYQGGKALVTRYGSREEGQDATADIQIVNEGGAVSYQHDLSPSELSKLTDKQRSEFAKEGAETAGEPAKQLGPRQSGPNYAKAKSSKPVEAGSKEAKAARIPEVAPSDPRRGGATHPPALPLNSAAATATAASSPARTATATRATAAPRATAATAAKPAASKAASSSKSGSKSGKGKK